MINDYFGIKLHDSNDPDVWLNTPPFDDDLNMNEVATELTRRSTVWKTGKGCFLLNLLQNIPC